MYTRVPGEGSKKGHLPFTLGLSKNNFENVPTFDGLIKRIYFVGI